MTNQISITSNAIIFSKWSRKGYAIFASLQKVVNIAQVTIDICMASLAKNKYLQNLLNQETQLFTSELDELDKNELNSNCLRILLLELGLITLDEPCSLSLHTFKNNKSPYLVKAAYGLFLYFNYD